MSGPLTHSPAQILREAIIALGLGTDPDDSMAWPVYATNKPDSPDTLVVTFDAVGRLDGKTSPDREVQEFHGARVVVRHARESTGFTKARSIQIGLDGLYDQQVQIDATDYLIHAISRDDSVSNLGREQGNARRLFSFNCRMTVRQL